MHNIIVISIVLFMIRGHIVIDSNVVAYIWLLVWIWDNRSKAVEGVLHIQVFNQFQCRVYS